MGQRPVETRPEGPIAGWGSWQEGSEPPPHQLGGMGVRCKLASGAGKIVF